MNQPYPFLPGNDPEPDGGNLEMKRRNKTIVAALLTVLELGDTAYALVSGNLHDLKLIVTIAIWCILALVWYSIFRKK
jgi:hypothetical protein